MKTTLLGGALLLALVAAGCDGAEAPDTSGTPGASGTPRDSASTGPTGEPGRCRTSQLAAQVRPAGAAAGSHYATLVLRNTSAQTCRVQGYGGIQLADGARRPIATRQDRDRTHPPRPVAVAPGEVVSAVLHWGVVPGQGEPDDRPCQPEPAYLLVIPPDETTHLTAAWPGGPVCQQGRIGQWAYAPGIVEPG